MNLILSLAAALRRCFGRSSSAQPRAALAGARAGTAALWVLWMSVPCAAWASPQTLTIWLVGDDVSVQILQPAVNAFRQLNPQVTVRVQAVPWSDAVVKYSAALASRSGPDIITGGNSYGIELGARGGLLDMRAAVPELVKSLESGASNRMLKSLQDPKGALYALPFDATVQLLYYRTDRVQAPPQDWDALLQEIVRQRAAGNRGLVQGWGNVAWIGFLPYLYQVGGSLYDDQCTRATIAEPAALKALAFYARLYREGGGPTDVAPDMESGLDNGTYALGHTHSQVMAAVRNTRPQLAARLEIAPLPRGPNGRRTAFIGGTVMGITRFTPNAATAAQFVRTVYRPEILLAMAQRASSLGVLWLPGARLDLIEKLDLPARQRSVLLEQLADAEGAPNCPGWQRVHTAVTRAIQEVVVGGADPAASLAKAERKMNLALRPR